MQAIGTSSHTRWALIAPLTVITAVLAVVTALALVLPREPALLESDSLLIRVGQPVLKAMFNLAAAGTLGGLVLAAIAIPPASPAHRVALDLSAGCAAAWSVLSGCSAVLSFVSVAGTFSPEVFASGLAQFLSQIELGQAWLLTTLGAAALSVMCFAARSPLTVMLTTALGLAVLVPLALQGHAAGAGAHPAASSALWLHSASAAVWVGGLAMLALLYGSGRRTGLATVLPRYSTVALLCFVIVAASGTIGAMLRLESPSELLSTSYGLLLLSKILILAALGGAGAWQRTRLLSRLSEDEPSPIVRRLFWRLAGGELVLMGVAMGLAAVLARTPTPGGETIADTPSEQLTGQPLPAPFSLISLVTVWAPDPVWLIAAGLGTAFYVVGARRLRQRGAAWPVGRSVAWLAAMALIVYATSGAPGVYGTYLFSVHMTTHMILAMLIPILLTLGAPITLALRAIRPRSDGSRGPREWIMVLIHSLPSRVLTHPVVAATLFAGSLVVFYYTPLLSWAVEDPIGHVWMVAHFLVTGFLFTQTMIGIDPLPRRFPFPLRLLTLLVTMAFHGFFGMGIMSLPTLLLPDWYGPLTSEWGIDPLQDQVLGGGIGWTMGELPTFILGLVASIQWARSDGRETRRKDRNALRTGDAELAAYNEQLARLAQQNIRER